MIRVTADIFSGRPNPVWIVEDPKDILKDIAHVPQTAAKIDSGFQGLGNRGLVVDLLQEHLPTEYGLPTSFRVGAGGHSHGIELAEKLLATMTSKSGDHPAASTLLAEASIKLPLDGTLKKYILDNLPGRNGSAVTHEVHVNESVAATVASKAATCAFETGHFNPSFWNDPAHITKNNCYAYAANRRTDTFPQPGRASGHMYAKIDCTEVTKGAVSDGASIACAPANQAPRWYMALVIAPGPGFVDYHWYRKATEGFWGHKPGGTAARNTDNSGHIVMNPQTANRGPYTIFCGFMYAQKKMAIR